MLMIKQMVGVYQQTELLQYSRYSHTCYVGAHARTPFHLDMTLPHRTAGSKVPLQLAEVLGEASQLLGLPSPLPPVPVWLPSRH